MAGMACITRLWATFVGLAVAVSAASDEAPREHAGLHNVIAVTPKLLSGSAPEGDAGFRSLAKLGVKTVVSVDGARPDVAAAKAAGLRYVHLPIGYDGVPRAKALLLAKAVDLLPGKVYLHCHHGKHRSPAAAAAVKRCLDPACSAEAALAILKAAGTDPNYQGLFADVAGMKPASPEELAKLPSEFPEAARVDDLPRLMVEAEQRFDRLKAIRAAGWKTPLREADLDPPHEALLLREAYTEMVRLPAVAAKPESFRNLLSDAVRDAKELETELRGPQTKERLEASFKKLSAGCVFCHRQYRDVPMAPR